MAKVIMSIQNGVKTSSSHISIFILKVVSAFIVAVTVSLIFQEMIGFGTFSFVLISITVLLGLVKMMSRWGLALVLVFDLICILIALLLRMYVLIAPGA
ncbi:MAG: hypothetical protein KDD34_07720 [Bdellovibrionales bacterium]|nr:hypothetical protein [Bdellovibrionales bacterium]